LQQLDHGLVPVRGRPPERRPTVVVLRVGVDLARREQQLDHAYVYLAIKIKKNGRIFTFNSDSQESGPYPKRKWYVTHFLKGLWDTDREQDNYYPLPIRITPETFEVPEESDGTFQSPRTPCQ
jgi:hypothetical protein